MRGRRKLGCLRCRCAVGQGVPIRGDNSAILGFKYSHGMTEHPGCSLKQKRPRHSARLAHLRKGIHRGGRSARDLQPQHLAGRAHHAARALREKPLIELGEGPPIFENSPVIVSPRGGAMLDLYIGEWHIELFRH